MKNNLIVIFSIIFVIIFSVGYGTAYSQSEEIPKWVKSIALLWGQGEIGDEEFFGLIEFLLERKIIILQENVNEKYVDELKEQLHGLKKRTVSDVKNAYDDGYKKGLADGSKQDSKTASKQNTDKNQVENKVYVMTDRLKYSFGDVIKISGYVNLGDVGESQTVRVSISSHLHKWDNDIPCSNFSAYTSANKIHCMNETAVYYLDSRSCSRATELLVENWSEYGVDLGEFHEYVFDDVVLRECDMIDSDGNVSVDFNVDEMFFAGSYYASISTSNYEGDSKNDESYTFNILDSPSLRKMGSRVN